MARYRLGEGMVFDRTTNTWIPPTHRLWAEYEQWIADGNTPDPEYTLDELKTIVKERIKARAYRVLEEAYSLQEQIFIMGLMAGYTATDRTNFINVVNANRQKLANLFQQINACTTIDELKAIVW